MPSTPGTRSPTARLGLRPTPSEMTSNVKATAETRGGARMLLDPFLYDFAADHQRALREAAERAARGRARVQCWRPVIPCLRRFTSWGIPSGGRPPSRRPRSLGRTLWVFNLADHDSRTSAGRPARRCRRGSGVQDRGERDRTEDLRRTWPTDEDSGASGRVA